MSLQHIPEFTHCCVNSRSIYLVRRDCTMNHVARLAIHEEANIRTCWRFSIGFLRKHCCLHLSPRILSSCSEVSVQHVRGTRVSRNTDSRGDDDDPHARAPSRPDRCRPCVIPPRAEHAENESCQPDKLNARESGMGLGGDQRGPLQDRPSGACRSRATGGAARRSSPQNLAFERFAASPSRRGVGQPLALPRCPLPISGEA